MQKKQSFMDVSRRGLVGATGLGAAALAAPALAGVSRQAMSDYEKANEDLVTRFCEDWAKQDVEVLIPYLADDIEYHVWEGGMVVNGHDSFRKGMAGFMNGMQEVRWDILRSTAMGDLVLNERIDYFIMKNGKDMPNSPFHITGIFLVRDGKIKYWKDYNLSQEEA